MYLVVWAKVLLQEGIGSQVYLVVWAKVLLQEGIGSQLYLVVWSNVQLQEALNSNITEEWRDRVESYPREGDKVQNKIALGGES